SGLSETNWKFEPQKHGGTGMGISALDASYILQFLVGLRSLSSEQQLACDTSGNGTLSALDAAYILQYLVGLIPHLPVTQSCGSDWEFLPVPAATANQVLIEPAPAGASCQLGAIALEPLVSDAANQDFLALLFGDCTGNWQPPANPTGAALVARSLSRATVRLGSPSRERGRVRYPVLVEAIGGVHALSMQITYDPSALRLAVVHPSETARDAL